MAILLLLTVVGLLVYFGAKGRWSDRLILAGIACLVLAAVAIGAGAFNRSKASDALDELDGSSYEEHQDNAELADTVAMAAGVIGVATIVGGAFLRGRDRGQPGGPQPTNYVAVNSTGGGGHQIPDPGPPMAPPSSPPPHGSSGPGAAARIGEAKELLDQGLITQADFDAKRQSILDEI